MTVRRLLLPFSISLGLFLVAAAPSLAQRSQSQQQRVGIYLTPVLRSNQRISHTRVLYLPGPAATAITTKPSSGTGGGSTKGGGGGGGKKGGGGSTGGGGSATCATSNSGSYTVGCVVAPTTTSPEAEEEIAADPATATNPASTYVAAVSDFSLRGGYNTTKWAISTDGGSTWSQNFVPLGAQNQPETSGGTLWAANSDPDVAIDNSGNVYLSDLYLGSTAFPNGIFVSSSTLSNLSSGNFSYSNTIPVIENNSSNNTTACEPGGPNPLTGAPGFCLEDKPWIAVDNSNTATAGTVYVVWDHFWSCYNVLGVVACNDGPDIYLSYSTTGGASWSAPIKLDPTGSTIPSGQPQSGNIEGPQVAVGPDGTVYVAYEAFDPSGNTRWQYLTEAKPSGSGSSLSLSFSAPFVVTPGFQDLTFSALYRVNSFPSLAIGPQSQVYLEYADQPLSNAQIEFDSCTSAPCTTSGQFSAQPQAVTSTDPGQEFFPSISVDSNGVIDTSWFDTRNSPNNTADFDVYAAFNSGAGFSSIARVTPTTINTGVASFIGDYAGIAVGLLDVAHPVWNDLTESCGLVTCKLSGTMQSTTLTLP